MVFENYPAENQKYLRIRSLVRKVHWKKELKSVGFTSNALHVSQSQVKNALWLWTTVFFDSDPVESRRHLRIPSLVRKMYGKMVKIC